MTDEIPVSNNPKQPDYKEKLFANEETEGKVTNLLNTIASAIKSNDAFGQIGMILELSSMIERMATKNGEKSKFDDIKTFLYFLAVILSIVLPIWVKSLEGGP